MYKPLLYITMITFAILLSYAISTVRKSLIDMKTIKQNKYYDLKLEKLILEHDLSKRENIIKNLTYGLIVFNINGFVISSNNTAKEILGFDIKENDSYDEVLDFKDEIVKSYRKMKDSRMKEEGKVDLIKDETRQILEYTMVPTYKYEILQEVMFIFSDITASTVLREALYENEKSNTITDLISGVAHELKNPLSNIKSYTELIGIKQDDKEFLEKSLCVIESEVDRMSEIINSLLDYTNPDIFLMKEIELKKLFDYVISIFKHDFVKHRIKVILDIDDVTLFANKSQIMQIIINILSNARDAMLEGGELSVCVRHTDKFVNIRISDDGQGIKAENLKKIFEPYFSTKEGEKGHGLGLSICEKMIGTLNGTIDVFSNEGRGTDVLISVPKKEKRI